MTDTNLAIVPPVEKPRQRHTPATVAASTRLAKLQTQIKAAQAAERAALTRQAAIVGRVVIEAMCTDAALQTRVAALLASNTTKAERNEVSMLIDTERIFNEPPS